MKPDTFENWIGGLYSGFSQSFALFALVESGALQFLKEHSPQPCSAAEVAASLKLDRRILSGVFNIMSMAESGIIEFVPPDKFLYGKNGDWAFREGARGLNQIFIGGYADVFANLLNSLKGTAQYARNYNRSPAWVAEGTHTFTGVLAPYIAAELKKTPHASVLDLGCGTGRLLMGYAEEHSDLTGTGIDIAPESIKIAEEICAGRNLATRLNFLTGDVFDLEKLTSGRTYTHVCANFFLHEFMYEKNNRLPELLKLLKKVFPGAQLICTEFNAIEMENYSRIPIEKRMPMLTYHHLIHSLSNQGIPMPAKEWQTYFESHGVKVEKTRTLTERQLSIYFLRL